MYYDLSCGCDYDGDFEWYYYPAEDFSILETKRGRKCCSCGQKLKPGAEVMKFERYRSPSDRCNYLEESIYGEEVPLADWYMCEDCGGLSLAVTDLGMCYNLGDNLKQEIHDFMQAEREWKERMRNETQ